MTVEAAPLSVKVLPQDEDGFRTKLGFSPSGARTVAAQLLAAADEGDARRGAERDLPIEAVR